MELLWTPEAIQDREDIYDYIEVDNPFAVLTLDELIAEKHSSALGLPKNGPGELRVPLSWSSIVATWSCMTSWKRRYES